MKRLLFALLLMPLPAFAELAPVVATMSCADLVKQDLTAIGGDGSQVTTAEETTSDGIAVCSVTGTLAPKIGFQVILPSQTWTQRYLQVGCGGLCGNITLQSGASAGCAVMSAGGFVMAATDMGHSGQDAAWGLDDQQRQDFAHRAQHLTALASKALIQAFYGQAPAYSYFNGCSDGGREAIMEAMRYPDDFDGIIAGAPAMLFQVQNTLHHGWLARSNMDASGKSILLSAKLPALHAAVLAACDALDGLADGLISQPALCQFDPATLACQGEDSASCLTPAEVVVVKAVYDGPRDASGVALTQGGALYGSELNWQGVFVPDSADQSPMSAMISTPVLQNLAFEPARPEMSLADLEFSTATLDALRARHPQIDATSPDLSAFEKADGKLILWHGLADPHIAPANTLALHKAMIATLGAETVHGFERLYLLPGMGHCGGGQGPSQLDLLTPMLDWVEQGKAPGAVITSTTAEVSRFGQPQGVAGGGHGMPQADLGVAPLPEMTRPAYPWPATAAFTGNGNWTDATNWTQWPDAETVALRDWAGADFFTPFTLEK
jgi:hypothetical protein